MSRRRTAHARPAAVPRWAVTDGKIQTRRSAEFWTGSLTGSVDCALCYRRCKLADGQTGPCGYRRADAGRMELVRHGQIASCVRQVRGYGPDPFLTFRPGQTSLFLGGVNCTATCIFCMSREMTWAPERLKWGKEPPAVAPADSLFYGVRTMMTPYDAVAAAKHWECSSILFGINEPTLSLEWTVDVASLAKEAGLDVCVETNGFAPGPVIRRLAPYVDAVDVGVKGSADPGFYARWMKSDGAVPTVLASLALWRAAGAHVIVGDLVAPSWMQPDEVFYPAAEAFYRRVAAELGPVTDVLSTVIMESGPMIPGEDHREVHLHLGNHRDPAGPVAYERRIGDAVAMGRAAGLFSHGKNELPIPCPSCGGTVLQFREACKTFECRMPTHFCGWWSHVQNVQDGRCAHCGTAVPVVTLAADQLAAERARVRAVAATAGLPL